MRGHKCWNWTAALSDGYGLFWWNGSTVAAHRLAYVALVGPIPDGLELDHKCRNRACVNPAHLRIITHQGNVLAGKNFSAVNAAKRRCGKGHEFSIVPRGDGTGKTQRRCIVCRDERYQQKAKAARKAKWEARWAASQPLN
jgi:hypothetical protein